MGDFSWFESYGDDQFMEFNMSKLGIDNAYLKTTTNTSNPVYLYELYEECFKCAYVWKRTIANITQKIYTGRTKLYRVLTKILNMSVKNSTQNVLCDLDPQFGEFGVYKLHVSDNGCDIQTLKEPVNIYFPILTVFLIYTAIISAGYCIAYLWKKRCTPIENEKNNDALNAPPNKRRVKSLDTFRGLAVVIMLFAHFRNGGYSVLTISVWNGLLLPDLAYPFFFWIMGVCVPISIMSSFKKGVSSKSAILNVVKRCCKLCALGVFLKKTVLFEPQTFFPLLMYLAFCYFVAATLCLIFMNNDEILPENKFQHIFKDILTLRYQWLFALLVLAAHCLITFLLPVPGCPTGYLGPGGYHENGEHRHCTGGAAGYIDQKLIGPFRWYPLTRDVYQSDVFESGRILSLLTSTVQVFIGMQAGVTLQIFKEHKCRIIRWLCWSVVLGLMGGVLCGFSKEDGVIPLNRSLMSVSFVLVTSSFAFLLLSIFYFLIDVRNVWSGKPFIFVGMNAIIIYAGHRIADANLPIHWRPPGYTEFPTHFLMLLENVWAIGCFVLIAFYLYKIKFFYII